jgi:hypothetical protein
VGSTKQTHCKATHSSIYLTLALITTHPTSKPLSPHRHRARAQCDQDSLHAELVLLGDILGRKLHRTSDSQVFNYSQRVDRSTIKLDSAALLPYVGSILNRISSALSRHNIKYLRLPPRTISSLIRSVKDDLDARDIPVGNIRTPQPWRSTVSTHTAILSTRSGHMDPIIR